jgi:organic radical activating enzyme
VRSAAWPGEVGLANLVEIFWSAQGEGPHLGRSTVFVRFGECDLRCAWCDSPQTWRPANHCRIEEAPGSGRFHETLNPVTATTVAAALDALVPRAGSFLSLTGGEPLLQPDAVVEIAALGRERGLRVSLETHGLGAPALSRVIDAVDVVSMDWKLPSDVKAADPDAQPAEAFAERHQAFLACAHAGAEVYVKVVVTPNTAQVELDDVCRRVARTAPDVPLILQPVTPAGRVRERSDAKVLLAHLRRCEKKLADVRLIPQTHTIYGAR